MNATDYTVQMHIPSGEINALRWSGDTITGVSAALHHDDVAALMLDPDVLAAMDYDNDDAEWASTSHWHPPTVHLIL